MATQIDFDMFGPFSRVAFVCMHVTDMYQSGDFEMQHIREAAE